MDSKQLFSLVYSGKISKEEFSTQYFKREHLDNEEAVNLIRQELTSHDGLRIEHAVTALFKVELFESALAEELCNLLIGTGHYAHENIAWYLHSLKDPSTTVCLYKAIYTKFGYLNYDDTYDLARICIKALGAIDNAESINILANISTSGNADDESRDSVLANYAQEELENRQQD